MAKPEVSLLDADLNEIKEIALSIQRFSHVADKLAESGLNERAIIILLQDMTGLTQKQIKKVMEALPQLKQVYCTPPK